MKAILLLIISSIFIFASILEEKANLAYKNRDFKKAFILYKEDAKSGNLKSLLMVGLFLEKGLYVPKDEEMSIKVYKSIVKKIKTHHNIKDLKIILLALKRLYLLTKDERYKDLIIKVDDMIDKSKSHLNSDIDDFLKVCPSAKIVDSRYREGIWEFDCILFDKFPNEMAQFMKLRYDRFIAINSRNNSLLSKIDSKIEVIIKPIIKFLEQDLLDCYVNATYNTDIQSCNYDFFVKIDPLKFKNYSKLIAKRLSQSNTIEYKLSKFEKDRLVNRLIEIFSYGNISKNTYYHIVKIQ